jgi:putative MATE family efflux protein
MSQKQSPHEDTRPPEIPAAALPFETHEGLAPVAVRSDTGAAALLVTDPIGRTVLRTALPAVASSLLMTLFASVDTYWVGTRIGPAGLAAVTTSIFWVWVVISLGEMVSIGLTAVAARRYGQGRADDAAFAAGSALQLAVVLGAVVGAVLLAMLPLLFRMMNAPPEVAELGRRYLGIYLIGTPFIFSFFAIDAAFRASGDSRTPFLILAVSVAVTLVLDPMLILGLGPAPKLGIAGAAVATIAIRILACFLGLWLALRRGLIRFAKPDWSAIGAICRVGLPTASTGAIFSLIYVVVGRATTPFGTPAIAALGIGHRVESWLFMIGVGFGAATAAIVGQNLGAGRPDRASRAGWIATGTCTAFGVVFCVAELIAPEWFAGLFSRDAAVIAEGARYLRIAALSQLAVCAEIVLEGALGGAGHTVAPMLSSTAITLLRVPLAGWAAARWGVSGIWWVLCITAIARGLGMVALWRSGGWRHKSV